MPRKSTGVPENGWSKYEKLVLYRLKEQDEKLDKLVEDVSTIRTSVTVLKVKVAMFGGAAGAIFGAIAAYLSR